MKSQNVMIAIGITVIIILLYLPFNAIRQTMTKQSELPSIPFTLKGRYILNFSPTIYLLKDEENDEEYFVSQGRMIHRVKKDKKELKTQGED